MDSLTTLATPRRNHYFYGKLLDELHLRMEQEYFNDKRWTLNRLALGRGVLCGLELTANGSALCVSAGVAIDGLGREIVLPNEVCIDPWKTPGDCGTTTTLSSNQEHDIWVGICFRECRADFVPALVSDCKPNDRCSPSTIVESYCLVVREGSPPDLPPSIERLCTALSEGETADDKRQNICKVLSAQACDQAPDDPCIALGTVTLKADGTIGTVKAWDKRPLVYSNDVLFDLLLCAHSNTQGTQGPQDPQGPQMKLPRIVRTNWPHDGEWPLDAMMKDGLTVDFDTKITPTTQHGRAWFIVTAEQARPAEGSIAITQLLATIIKMQNAGKQALFMPSNEAAQGLRQLLKPVIAEGNTQNAGVLLIRVILKCDFLVGPGLRVTAGKEEKEEYPVDGDFLRGKMPTGDGVPGGEFESWFFLKASDK